jgi:hypothetical protein
MDKRRKLIAKQLLGIAFISTTLQLLISLADGQTLDYYVYFPVVMKPVVLIEPPYDMVMFMAGDGSDYGTLYEVQHSDGSQTRHQTQTESYRFFHTKGNELSAEWEELWYSEQYIYRGTDTSPGSGLYYTLRDNNQYGSKWIPRYWDVGDIYERSPEVTFYRKEDCLPQFGGVQRTWLRFEAYYPSYTFPSNITINNVVEFSWLLNPNEPPMEKYFYAQDYGLVRWESNDGRGLSYISEIHAPGARPNNTREAIPCLDTSNFIPKGLSEPLIYAK